MIIIGLASVRHVSCFILKLVQCHFHPHNFPECYQARHNLRCRGNDTVKGINVYVYY